MREFCKRLGGRARVEVLGEILHRLVGGLEETIGLGLERERDGASGALLESDEVRGDPQHVIGEARDHVVAGHARFEPERRALNRGRDIRLGHVGQDVGNVLGVAGALLGTPVGLVNLLLDHRSLECPIGKCIHGVEIHVVVAEEFLELLALAAAVDERLGRFRRQAQRHTEALIMGDPLFHLWHIRGEAVPHLRPVIAWVHEGRVGEMAETVAEIH